MMFYRKFGQCVARVSAKDNDFRCNRSKERLKMRIRIENSILSSTFASAEETDVYLHRRAAAERLKKSNSHKMKRGRGVRHRDT